MVILGLVDNVVDDDFCNSVGWGLWCGWWCLFVPVVMGDVDNGVGGGGMQRSNFG